MLRLDLDGQWWFEALWTPERAEVLKRRIEGERLITPPADGRILPGVPAPGSSSWSRAPTRF